MPAVGADDSGEHERDYRRSRRGRKRSSLAQQLRQLGDGGGDAPGRYNPPTCLGVPVESIATGFGPGAVGMSLTLVKAMF